MRVLAIPDEKCVRVMPVSQRSGRKADRRNSGLPQTFWGVGEHVV